MALLPDPWQALAGTDLVLERMHIRERGRYYHVRRAIVIRSGMLLVEERSTLWHELAHAARGDRRCDTGDRDEWACDQLAARWAIPIEELARAARICRNHHELADELKVTRHLLDIRLAQVRHPTERAEFARLFTTDDLEGC